MAKRGARRHRRVRSPRLARPRCGGARRPAGAAAAAGDRAAPLRTDPARQLRHRSLPGATPDARALQRARLRRLDQDQRVHDPGHDQPARPARPQNGVRATGRRLSNPAARRLVRRGGPGRRVEDRGGTARSGLQQHASRGIEVINAGVAGYGTGQEMLLFEQEGAKYDPQVVVVVVFLGNDIGDNSYRHDPQRGEQTSRPTFELDSERMIRVVPGALPEARPDPRSFLRTCCLLYNVFETGVLLKAEQRPRTRPAGVRERRSLSRSEPLREGS